MMDESLKVDLLGGEAERRARRTTALIAVFFAAAVGILAAVGAGASYRAVQHGTSVLDEVGNLPIIADIRRLAWGDSSSVLSTPDDRMTFLILGVGGAGHDGPELTDTILLATADLKTKRVGLLSIPRDLAYPLGSGRFVKINSVNSFAEQSHPGNGARETANAFEDLFGIRIDHVVKIDFKAFEELIDAVGGLDVTVERAFVDREYPTEDDKYQTVSFEAGPRHMDGATALKYARSRHGSNGEGSDFARAKRQQIIILALKEKLLSKGTLANPSKLLKLYEAIASNIQTDLSAWDAMKIAPLAGDFSSERITTHVLTNDRGGELVSETVNGSYLLFPKDQNWATIRAIAADPFQTTEERAKTEQEKKTPVSIELRNGTTIPGLASRFAETLRTEGYTVETIGNATARGYEKTVIYDLTNGKRNTELAKLKTLLNANVSTTIPAWLSATATAGNAESAPIDPERTEFLVILGSSSNR
jgi:polyisoprenyl-teichoic acid--peptidoglycan teichoic acid transferase